MAIGRVAGSSGEIVAGGRAGRTAVRLADWSIVDGWLEGRVVFVDPFHAAAGAGVFRAAWGRNTREWRVRGDLASGAVAVINDGAPTALEGTGTHGKGNG